MKWDFRHHLLLQIEMLRADISHEELSERLGDVTERSLARYIAGKTHLTEAEFGEIAKALKIDAVLLASAWASSLGFRNAYVFDVSQTDGVDLPEMREISGDPGENLDRLTAFVRSRGIQLAYNENIAPALGISYGGRIALLPGQSKAEEFSTLVHETAHELLHKAERRTATTKTVRETEAEAVAFVVGKAVGLVTGTASADYIQLYHGNASLLAESLEVIQQTAAVIFAALGPSIEDAVINEELAEVAA